MITHIYQSKNHPNSYLLLPADREDDFAQVPTDVRTQLGELQKIVDAEIGPGSLGIDLLQAKNDFDRVGYHVVKSM
ncbi:hypothetical protein GCM10027347_56360 [Larkinella harenae]